jgi:putative (di)nucleoside polyphosphate hydrolase
MAALEAAIHVANWHGLQMDGRVKPGHDDQSGRRRLGLDLMSKKPKPADLPYRPCVGVMLINKEGSVFVGRRIDQTVEGWQMPQGGIDEGETPAQAVMRELKEETGTDKAEILREHDDWLAYDLPAHLIGVALHGKYRGQKQKWFALRFTGTDSDIDLLTHEPEFATWRWVSMEELPKMIVPFKRDTYRQVIAAFKDLGKV